MVILISFLMMDGEQEVAVVGSDQGVPQISHQGEGSHEITLHLVEHQRIPVIDINMIRVTKFQGVQGDVHILLLVHVHQKEKDYVLQEAQIITIPRVLIGLDAVRNEKNACLILVRKIRTLEM